jgi:uncharacterized membrane protein
MIWLRKRVTAAALSAASVIIALQLITPGVFDFIFDLILLGIIAVVGRLANRMD